MEQGGWPVIGDNRLLLLFNMKQYVIHMIDSFYGKSL